MNATSAYTPRTLLRATLLAALLVAGSAQAQVTRATLFQVTGSCTDSGNVGVRLGANNPGTATITLELFQGGKTGSKTWTASYGTGDFYAYEEHIPFSELTGSLTAFNTVTPGQPFTVQVTVIDKSNRDNTFIVSKGYTDCQTMSNASPRVVTYAFSPDGNVNCKPNPVATGDTTICTATANAAGYVLDKLTVTEGTTDPITCDGNECTLPNVQTSVTVKATFKKETYTVGATTVTGGTVRCTSAARGEDATCTAQPDEGYELDSMTVTSGMAGPITCSGNECTVPNIQSNVTVTPTFEKKKYSISVNPATGGKVSCTPATDVEHGTGTSSCTVTEDSGYTFDSMTVNSGTANISCNGLVCTLTSLESDVSVQPTFTLSLPALGELVLLLSGIALAGAAAPTLRRRERKERKQG